MDVRMRIGELRDSLTASIRRIRLVLSGDVSRGRPLERPLRRFPPGETSATEALEDDRAGR